MRASSPAMIVLFAGLAGCSLIPDYHRPALPVATQWPNGPAEEAANPGQGAVAPASELGWRDFFTDPVLQELVALSLANNRDLRVAALNVVQAQAQYQSDRASLFPTIDATAGLQRSRTPAKVEGLGQFASSVNVREYSIGLSAVSWELDLFGRIRSQAKGAAETYLSNAETRLTTQISFVAQVGSEYLTWLADRDALAVSEDTVKVQGDSLRLTQMRTERGTANAQDVAQAETTLRTAEANVAQYSRQVAQDMDELVVLVGAPLPDSLVARMNAEAGLGSEPAFPALPAGLPADLLERRPDIRAAEHTLLAANANIGAARAAFFPQITLTAQYGTASSGLQHLFARGSSLWLFEPSVSLPIFDAGRNQANLDIAKVEERAEVADYEKAIQSAFHDVADALAGHTTYVNQVAAEQRLVDAATRYYNLADMRFRNGADNYLNVLVAQNSLLNARLTLISLQLAQLQNSITLYKALGGGWKEH
ncbi:MAG: multidrug transporter [Tardiphaga sp.]|nr:multidrug transporter [Tardiphaga sp.]